LQTPAVMVFEEVTKGLESKTIDESESKEVL
jgi:hypothetical protein